jgi:hypothetical protein
MKIQYLLLLFVSLVLSSSVVEAAPWSSKGWVKLGEQDVNGRVDRDRIYVGRHEGRFSKLTLVVEKDDIELLGMEVEFTNGQKFRPNVRHYFRKNSRTREIDLPGYDQSIKSIELTYKNVGRRGRARVEVWGWKTQDHGRHPGPVRRR